VDLLKSVHVDISACLCGGLPVDSGSGPDLLFKESSSIVSSVFSPLTKIHTRSFLCGPVSSETVVPQSPDDAHRASSPFCCVLDQISWLARHSVVYWRGVLGLSLCPRKQMQKSSPLSINSWFYCRDGEVDRCSSDIELTDPSSI
jgi:hypothetical protein